MSHLHVRTYSVQHVVPLMLYAVLNFNIFKSVAVVSDEK